MKVHLDIIMSDAEGAMERVLGTLRQRGFRFINLTAAQSPEHSSMHARITVESTRAIDPVLKQLNKLFDVKYIAISSMEAAVPHVHNQVDAQEQLGLCASL